MLKRFIAGAAITSLCLAATTQIQPSTGKTPSGPGNDVQFRSGAPTGLTTTRLATGLARPVFVTNDGVHPDWIYVVEQRSGSTGRIKVLDRTSGAVLSTFLSIPNVNTGSEQGLLGLCFDPDYANNGHFYVNFTRSNTTRISRFTVSSDPLVADSSSETSVYSYPQPYSNHNAGWIGFGPDNYLYISMGDGGSGGDPGNRAQNLNNDLGKMLRIDVSSLPYTIPEGNPFSGTSYAEVWAYGLRNVWRASFDRSTGDLWMGDVGQSGREEINFQASDSDGGENWGWRCYEGQLSYNTGGCDPASTMVFPVFEYSHGGNPYRCSVTGGYVYRGSAIPDLVGTYFYADYCSSQIWSFRFDGSNVSDYLERTQELTPDNGSIGAISSFGEDYFGELYICDLNGEIFKLLSDGPVEPTGACCFNDQCIAARTPSQCAAVGGVYLGDDVACETDLCLTPPANDDCSGATVAVDGITTFDTAGASPSLPSESECTFGKDLWFDYQPPYSGLLLVSSSGTLFDPVVGIYGSTCPELSGEVLACGEEGFILDVDGSLSYRIRVGNAAGDTGSGEFVLSVIPAEEECEGDCNGDGQRDVNDVLALLADYGNPSDCDTNGDEIIDVNDVLSLLANYGQPCD